MLIIGEIIAMDRRKLLTPLGHCDDPMWPSPALDTLGRDQLLSSWPCLRHSLYRRLRLAAAKLTVDVHRHAAISPVRRPQRSEPRTLEKLRVVGGSPQFRRLGHHVSTRSKSWMRRQRCGDAILRGLQRGNGHQETANSGLEIPKALAYRPPNRRSVAPCCASSTRGRGGTGRRAGLKIRFREECGFDSHRPHQL